LAGPAMKMRGWRERRSGPHAFDRDRANAMLRQKHCRRQAYQAAARNENRHGGCAGSRSPRRHHRNALLANVSHWLLKLEHEIVDWHGRLVAGEIMGVVWVPP